MVRNEDVERVAETHFFIRPQIERTLRGMVLTDEGKKISGDYSNYYELWHGNFSDRFFDMTSLVRLGTAIESGLRQYHRAASGVEGGRGMYQRLVPDASALVAAFKKDCEGYDLTTNPEWAVIQELMTHRHLYAHRSGLVDDKYIEDLLSVSGVDIRPEVASLGYPREDVYWFTPLQKLPDYIEASRRFFKHLPTLSF